MKAILEIRERFLLSDLLPAQSDAITMRVVQGLHKVLAFSEEEKGIIGLAVDEDKPGSLKWDPTCTYTAEIEISDISLGVIRDALNKMNAERKLRVEHLPLFERFVDLAETGESSDA